MVKNNKSVSNITFEDNSENIVDDIREELLKIIDTDVEVGTRVQEEYIRQKVLDIKHYHGAKPSELENLTKKDWQSDRNYGLSRAIADSYQATLLSTCWNPDSINFIATRINDIDTRVNQEKFTKWGMGKQEANAKDQVDAFIKNRVVVGFSAFKIYRKCKYVWFDKRIPVKNAKGETYKWEIKTENIKIERGVIENIADIDDILMPAYGEDIQDMPFFIHVLHLDGEFLLSLLDNKTYRPQKSDEYRKKLYNHAYKEKLRELGQEKLNQLGITEATISDIDVRRLTIDLYEWYGFYEYNGKNEKYRVTVDLINREVLSFKPLRKIQRLGKIPFVVGGLDKVPGQVRSDSLMKIIAPIVNAFNNVFNQKTDFQYVENCPFGFHNPEEGYQEQVYELEPGISYPVGGKPSENVYFPNLSRSMAWAESDIRILFELLERATGAASYFMSRTNQSKTLGQDVMIDKHSETRFGLWVSRIIDNISEAIDMWFQIYQDYPIPGLAERVVGEDGQKIFPNLSIDSLRGDNVVQMNPDVVAGSKVYRRQLQLWAFQASQQMVWLNPQINPRGNWKLCTDTFKELLNLSDNEIGYYFPPEPKANFNESELNNEFTRFMNGEDFSPPEGETMLAIQHLEGHLKQKEEKYHLLSEEYRPNFDSHLFKTTINVMKFMQNVQRDNMANQIATNIVMNKESGMMPQPAMAQPLPTPINPKNMNAPVAGVGQ